VGAFHQQQVNLITHGIKGNQAQSAVTDVMDYDPNDCPGLDSGW